MYVWINDYKVINLFGGNALLSQRLFYSYAGWKVGFYPVILKERMYVVTEWVDEDLTPVLIGPLDTGSLSMMEYFRNLVEIESVAHHRLSRSGIEDILNYDFRLMFTFFTEILETYGGFLTTLSGGYDACMDKQY